MKRLIVVLAAAGICAATPAAASAAPYIVVLKDGVDSAAVAGEHGRAHAAQVSHVYGHAVRGYAASMSAQAASRIAADPRVDLVEPDRPVSASAQTTPTGINRIDAELSPTAAINGVDQRVNVDVAIIDTGIDFSHPDLLVHTAGARNCSNGSSARDGNGHGTHVAGTVGALDNLNGVVGVAPGARLWPVRVLNNSGSGSWSSIICGVDFVTANRAQIEVANMSLGGTGTDGACTASSLHRAICNSVAAGVTYVVAAGNESDNAAKHVPAAYDEVITVSALADFNGVPGGGGAATCRSDVDDTFADFSNYGLDVDLIAPGVCINSAWKGGGYKSISGTSMASPHAAGAAALYKARNPAATPADVKSALQAAGNLGWNVATDPDGAAERLLNVSGF